MQTFLPYKSYARSARVIDPSRLGNQFYREGLTLLRGKWYNHTASRMWHGHFYSLGEYLLACYVELNRRGRYYPRHAIEVRKLMGKYEKEEGTDPPHWLGDEAFHRSHQSNLLRKDPVWYGKFGWDVPHDLPYVWPTNEVTV